MGVWVPYSEPWDDRVVIIGGRPMRDVKVTVPPEWLDRLKKGYMCIGCLEPLKEAWPEKCPNDWCGFPIRAEQADALLRNIERLETG